jgi:hypothetical protein
MYTWATERPFHLRDTSAMDDEIETGTDYLVSVLLVPKIELDIDPDDKVRGFTPPSDTRCIS